MNMLVYIALHHNLHQISASVSADTSKDCRHGFSDAHAYQDGHTNSKLHIFIFCEAQGVFACVREWVSDTKRTPCVRDPFSDAAVYLHSCISVPLGSPGTSQRRKTLIFCSQHCVLEEEASKILYESIA